MQRRHFIFFILLIHFFCEALYAQQPVLKRSLVYSTGYAGQMLNPTQIILKSNEGMVHFPLSMIQLYSKIFDWTVKPKNTWYKRALVALGSDIISSFLSDGIHFPFHEYGHARAIGAMGMDCSYGLSLMIFHNIESYTTISGLRYLELIILSLLNFPFLVGAHTAYAPNEKYNKTLDWRIIVTASGLNNQAFLGSEIGNLIYKHHGHFTYHWPYLHGKLSSLRYAMVSEDTLREAVKGKSGHDIGNLLYRYHQKGFNIKEETIKTGSWLSYFFSGTTYALWRGYWDYIKYGNPVVTPLVWKSIRFPELDFYLNASGLSFKLSSSYEVNQNLRIHFAGESIYWGSPQGEMDIGAEALLSSLFPQFFSKLSFLELEDGEVWLKGNLILPPFGINISLEMTPFPKEQNTWRSYFLTIGYNYHNAGNLHGARHIPNMVKGNTCHTLLLNIGFWI